MDSEWGLKLLISRIISAPYYWEAKSTVIPVIIQIISMVISMDLDSQPKPESEFISLIKQTISVGNSMSDSEPDWELVSLVTQMTSLITSAESSESEPEPEPELMSLSAKIYSYTESINPDEYSELNSLVNQIYSHVQSTFSEPPELKLISLIKTLIPLTDDPQLVPNPKPLFEDAKLLISKWSSARRDVKVITLIVEIINLVSSTDLDSLPKPESELMSVVTQTISFFNSMDLDSQPKQLRELIALISQKYTLLINSWDSELEPDEDIDFMSLVKDTLSLEPEPKLISLILQIVSLVFSINTKWEKLISFHPLLDVSLKDGKFQLGPKYEWNGKLECLPWNWKKFRFTGGADASHFLCQGCNGENHEQFNKAPAEIRHPLHPKHSLHLVSLRRFSSRRECYCCDEILKEIFYYCSACDFAVNFSCVQQPPDLSMDHPKWHEHTLALFPRQTLFTCSVCALAHSSCPFYICPPCDFAIHQTCISLPRVIRISRHPHRISFTHSFDHGDWSCGVCRRKIDNDFGGYSCIKNGCLYGAHSRCATQSNVWDKKELEGEPEEDIEEIEPFVTISDVIIQHFSHEHHHMRLDVNTDIDYDEDKLCQACTSPIYFGKFYSCTECDFILHEECANFRRNIHHPIHPHLLTLSKAYEGDYYTFLCPACLKLCSAGFFYNCIEEGCNFQLHVKCATTCEPLSHETHMHPLFLTSKPGEKERNCSVCQTHSFRETFNCIEECDFALCFRCANVPQKVRYKHDKHMLTLSYGDEKSTMTYWCEGCERKIDPKKRFYTCDDYCCVTLHMECLLGLDLYMKPGSSWIRYDRKVYVLPNHHQSRPVCPECKKRCPYRIVLKENDVTCCSLSCIYSVGDPWNAYFSWKY